MFYNVDCSVTELHKQTSRFKARAWSVVFPIDYTRSNHTREMLDIIYHRVLRKAILQGSNFWDVSNYLDMYEHNTLKVDFACRK